MIALGIDVGGSGIKGALVDTETGELASERFRLSTPQPATPKAVSETLAELVSKFDYKRVIGVSFPTVVDNNRALTSGNIDPSWKGVHIADLLHKTTGHEYIVHNDADLAGAAELSLGAGKGNTKGTVIMITIGTGLGSGIFRDGVLIPNIELGRVLGLDGKPIEFYAGDRARKIQNLSWKKWGKRFDFFLQHVVRVCNPNLFIIGGGASKKWDKFSEQITIEVPIKLAKFQNNAGIIGAAIVASQSIQNEYE